jgi:hypothetical protein
LLEEFQKGQINLSQIEEDIEQLQGEIDKQRSQTRFAR